MNKQILPALGLLLLLLMTAGQVNAAALTDSQVRDFIASLPAFQQLADEKAMPVDQLEEEQTEFDFTSPISSALQGMQGGPEYAEFNSLVKQHGFSSLEQWGGVGDKVFRAFMALELAQETSGMEGEMAQALREIEQNPHLSAEQRAQMKQMMTGSMQMMQAIHEAPAADIDAVRPHLPQLRQVIEQ